MTKTYTVSLNSGQTITITADQFDAADFATMLNNERVSFIALGGAVLNKHIIAGVLPVIEQEKVE